MYILDDLYWGNIVPTDKTVKENSEYRMLQKKDGELDKRLRETLTQEQKDIMKEQELIRVEMMSMTEQDMFISGFRIGARMVLDVLGKYDSSFEPIVECKGM